MTNETGNPIFLRLAFTVFVEGKTDINLCLSSLILIVVGRISQNDKSHGTILCVNGKLLGSTYTVLALIARISELLMASSSSIKKVS